MEREQSKMVTDLLKVGLKLIIKKYYLSPLGGNEYEISDASKVKKRARLTGTVIEEHSGALINLRDVPSSWIMIKFRGKLCKLFNQDGQLNLIHHDLFNRYFYLKDSGHVRFGDLVYIKPVEGGPSFTKNTIYFLNSTLFMVHYIGDYSALLGKAKGISHNLIDKDAHDFTLVIEVWVGNQNYAMELSKARSFGFYIIELI